MDRMLIERMIGAGVIVILLVLIAPALLDGRRDRESVTETVPLPEPELRTETIYLDGSQREAAAEASSPEPTVVANAPAPVKAPEAPETLPQPEPVAPPEKAEPKPAPAVEQTVASTLEGFAVQLGSFSSRDNANRFAAELSGEGYEAFVMEGTSNNKRVYRVRVGPRPTRAAAEQLAGTLSQAGHQGMVVTLPANAAARN